MLSTTLLYVCASADVFTFAGGASSDLVKSVSEFLGEPVALFLEYPNQTWPKVSIQIEADSKRKSFLEGLSQTLRLGTSDDQRLGLSVPEWPRALLFPVQRWPYEVLYERVHPRDIQVKDGKVSLMTEANQALNVFDLQAVSFDKQVSIHWVYARAALAVYAPSTPERDFLNVIACAVGAKYRVEDDLYVFEFDPKEFRNRAVARLASDIKKQRIGAVRGKWEYISAVFLHISDDQLTTAYATPESSIMFEVEVGTPIWLAGMNRLLSFTDLPPNHPPSEVARSAEIINLIDMTLPFEVDIRANGTIGMIVTGKDGKLKIHI